MTKLSTVHFSGATALKDDVSGRRVTLIIPPSAFLLDDRVFVSLGILRVAAVLESQGVVVGVLDLSGVVNYLDVVQSYFTGRAADSWVGITCTTPQLPAAVQIAKRVRAVAPQQRIALGGPHVTLSYAARKAEMPNGISGSRSTRACAALEAIFDHLVSGDGEIACFELFRPDCPKVIDADDNKGRFFMSSQDYEASPGPARHLVDLGSYHYSIEGANATSLIAQLGCPFHCGFCGGRNAKSLRLIRTRSVESIIAELRFLHGTYGYTGFMFYDDELNVSKSFVQLLERIYRLQQELGVKFHLRGFVKAELFTEEQAEAMVRAGFRWLLCGFEGANARILENIDKIATVEDNTKAVQYAKRHGLKVKALMSVGHPGECRQSILDVRDWLIAMKVDDFDCTVITTYPGTPYYDLAVPTDPTKDIFTYTQKNTGDRLHSFDIDYTTTPDYYKGDPNGGYYSYVFTDHLGPEDIVALRDQVEREVRQALAIPFYPGKVGIRYEHSMKQGLPPQLFRATARLADE